MFMPNAYRIKPTSSEERLEKLIIARMNPGADHAAVDKQIWNLFGEELAVMFTDLSGFSRGVAAFGIIHFLQIIYESQRVLTPCIDSYGGILLKVEADSMMAIFRHPKNALDCAIEMQRALKAYNGDKPDTDKILLCVGIGFGQVLRIGDYEVFGAEVNAASKLGEDIARSGEILVTEAVQKVLATGTPLSFTPHPEIPPGSKAAFLVKYAV